MKTFLGKHFSENPEGRRPLKKTPPQKSLLFFINDLFPDRHANPSQ
ncbi:hypothetical protein [Komagataeibacter europaeus]|nr:hypothetical protein [Komagataeibacter europaeus]